MRGIKKGDLVKIKIYRPFFNMGKTYKIEKTIKYINPFDEVDGVEKEEVKYFVRNNNSNLRSFYNEEIQLIHETIKLSNYLINN